MESVVVVPTYNEAGNIGSLVSGVMSAGDFSLLVVDDDSPDGTGRLADVLAQAYPGLVSVMHRRGKAGLGSAYVDGFRRVLAGPYSFVFQMDGDLSHDTRYLPIMREALRDGADVVIGSRYVRGGGSEGWPLRRRLLSKGGSFYARAVLGVGPRDVTGGFKGFRRDALERVDLTQIQSNGYAFQLEMNYLCHRLGLRFAEVPIVFRERQMGVSKLTGGIFWEALFGVWRMRARGYTIDGASAGQWPDLRSLIHRVAALDFRHMTAPHGPGFRRGEGPR